MKKFATMISVIVVGIAAVLLTTSAARAVLVNYNLVGTVSGSLDFGGGAQEFTDAALTVTGMTLSDVDTFAPTDGGFYAAMSTYSIAGIGDFTTDDSTGEAYFQFANNGGLIFQVGVTAVVPADNGIGPLIFDINGNIGPGDADNGAVALGGPFIPDATGFADRTLTNLAGHTLFLDAANISEFSVFAKELPEPGTLVLFGLGLVGLGLSVRRRKAA
ncbi:MAG: PEP-CTERM sorting domain-containing protein [Alphaproteobacteria bacterium]|nr:PEP-CTERM sorting domain-containing protein [Alphaproteobacteria bacterium]